MSVGISPSGVASLRAKFEQKDGSSSPPSRGRSPAASLSVTGDASRPISKVRTSFVAVEPSEPMGDLNASEDLGNKGHAVNGDRAEDLPTNSAVEKPKANGIDSTLQKPTEEKENKQTSPKEEDFTSPESSEKVDSASLAANPDKPKSTAEDKTAIMTPSDPKEVATVSDHPTGEGETSPLGSILKGSPFEQNEEKDDASNDRETGTAAQSEPAQSAEQQVTSPSTPMTNGKPKEATAQKVGSQSKIKMTARPSAVGKKTVAQPASSTRKGVEDRAHVSTVPAPITPKSAPTPSKQPIPKKTSPKSAGSIEPKREVLKDAKKMTAERPSRLSVAPKGPAAASKPVPKPGKKLRPTSPSSFNKPRPKSPTRAVRLPSSATAPTAASAAKLDAAAGATTKPRDRIPSNPKSLRQKPARTSLPAGSKPGEKAKDKPKSRLSTTSSKAPEGSFLDRMMRPTQSSSQKTHEKVEVKTPPKKTSGVRPKRKSDEKTKSEHVDTKEEQPIDAAASPTVQALADFGENPKTNGANEGIDEAVSASTAPVPSQ